MKKQKQNQMKRIQKIIQWFRASKKRWIGATIVLVVIVFGAIYLVNSSKKDKITFQTATVTKGTVVSTISASGKVLTTNTLSISTQASGVVKKVYVKDGDKVVVGQKLAEITLDSDGTLANAKAYASLVSAQNSVNSANNSYRSAQATVQKVLDEVKGHDSDETFTQKETRTKAEVANDNAYDGLRQSQANLISSGYSYRLTSPIITAPFSGIVESVGLVEGMVLTSSSSTTSINSERVAVIKGDSYPVISVSLSEVDVPNVSVGQKVTVTLDSISDKTFTGVVATVDRVGSTTSNVTSYTANIKLDSDNSAILPNMAATADIVVETAVDSLYVPSAALITQNGTAYAKTLVDGKQVNVPVEVGISSVTDTVIISGLSESQKVITGSVSADAASSATTKSVFSTGMGGGATRIQAR